MTVKVLIEQLQQMNLDAEIYCRAGYDHSEHAITGVVPTIGGRVELKAGDWLRFEDCPIKNATT